VNVPFYPLSGYPSAWLRKSQASRLTQLKSHGVTHKFIYKEHTQIAHMNFELK